MSDQQNYEDVTLYGLEDADEAKLLAAQNECTFIWSNKEGWPVGVIMSYVFHEGRFWLTASSQRARVFAVRRDPRVCVVVSSTGSSLGPNRTVTYKGRATLHDDDETKAWFYPALARAVLGDSPHAKPFVEFLDSPRRVIFEVEPTQRIGYDGVKMGRATNEWMANRAAENDSVD